MKNYSQLTDNDKIELIYILNCWIDDLYEVPDTETGICDNISIAGDE